MVQCWHEWRNTAGRSFSFQCLRCLAFAACPVCLGLGDQGVPPGGALVRYCQKHLAGVYAPRAGHVHQWVRLAGTVGLFVCADEVCLWAAVCPGCLGSLDVALCVEAGIVGMALFWCPVHRGEVGA